MSTQVNCSNEFPTTDQFYAEISANVVTVVFLAICCVLTAACIIIFVEELVFLQRIHYGNETKVRKLATILGLYPVTIIASLISLLVPSSTILLDLLVSCYLSVCFYTFVTLTIDYFGGEDKMVEFLVDDKVQLSTPPCCCCCCCILKPIKLTRKRLMFFVLCSLQVAVIRPILLFIAAVLWTDGRYKKGLKGSTSYLYITIITLISTLFSLYGTMVIYRASREHLKKYYLTLKYLSFKILLVLLNVQSLVFGILAMFDLPHCIGTRGPKLRASYINHSVLVIESFLLALFARKAYRRDERKMIDDLSEDIEAVDVKSVDINKLTDSTSGGGDRNTTNSVSDLGYSSYENKGADISDNNENDITGAVDTNDTSGEIEANEIQNERL